jgi:hypothetical protein
VNPSKSRRKNKSDEEAKKKQRKGWREIRAAFIVRLRRSLKTEG